MNFLAKFLSPLLFSFQLFSVHLFGTVETIRSYQTELRLNATSIVAHVSPLHKTAREYKWNVIESEACTIQSPNTLQLQVSPACHFIRGFFEYRYTVSLSGSGVVGGPGNASNESLGDKLVLVEFSLSRDGGRGSIWLAGRPNEIEIY